MITTSRDDISTLNDLWGKTKDVENGNDSGFGVLVTSYVCNS